MNTRSPHIEAARLQALRPALELRATVTAALRRFFLDAGFLDVETPIRLPTPALELHIDAEPSGRGFLRTSPELHMKRLLAAGYERLFQIGPCFRKDERGAIHHPEYTMLEWYRTGTDYLGILDDTQALLSRVCAAASACAAYAAGPIDFAAPWPRLSVREAFEKWAGWDPVELHDEERFERDLVGKVEPGLPLGRPVILMDYPAYAGALARPKPGDNRVAERWELYINGVEIANAFSELIDPAEQRRRFETWARERNAAGRVVYPLDEAFLGAMELGIPPAGGIALGVDRLVMVLAGATSLDRVIAFREDV